MCAVQQVVLSRSVKLVAAASHHEDVLALLLLKRDEKRFQIIVEGCTADCAAAHLRS